MLPKNASREQILKILEDEGGLREGTAGEVHRQTGVPEADIYGVGTFYHLLSDPDAGVRVCQGLSCQVAGSALKMAEFEAAGTKATYTACLGRCDMAPAWWDAEGDARTPEPHFSPGHPDFAIDLLAPDTPTYAALEAARTNGPEWVLDELESSGLTGRGGAGFPAHIKWRGVRSQAVEERYVVLNADEGEPGTFKDREVILRRPHLVIEGLAIAALTPRGGGRSTATCAASSGTCARDPDARALRRPSPRERWSDSTARWNGTSSTAMAPISAARRPPCSRRSKASAACRA